MVEVLTLGETMAALRSVGSSPRPVRLGRDFELSIAGAESNVAIGLARLGHEVGWAGVLGEDQFGELILRTLRAEGVDTSLVRRSASPTGLVVFENRLAGAVRVDYHRSASAGAELRPADLDAGFERRRECCTSPASRWRSAPGRAVPSPAPYGWPASAAPWSAST